MAHRALMLASVARGTSRLRGVPPGDDVDATRRAMESLGTTIVEEGETLRVEGRGFDGLTAPAQPLDARNSGTTMRLLAGLLAGRPFAVEIRGDDSLSRRPMERVAVPLRRMGARVETQGPGGHPPLRLQGGPLVGIAYAMPVASAQVKSAVLLAGLQARGATTIGEPAFTRDHTERMLRVMGARITCNATSVRLEPGGALRPLVITLPGDISSAAPWLAAAALRPGWRVVVEGVGVNAGRAGFLDVLERAGARVTREAVQEEAGEARATVVVEGQALRGVEVEPGEVPRLVDELPLVAVLGACARGITRVRGAAELRWKESDRIAGVRDVLRAMGAFFEELPDGFALQGPARLKGALIDARGDHRLAMAGAIAGLVAEGETEMVGAEAVDVSYPGFWEELERLTATHS